jgi:hypothetical protein
MLEWNSVNAGQNLVLPALTLAARSLQNPRPALVAPR